MSDLLIWNDLFYAARVQMVTPHVMDFELLEIVGITEDGVTLYWRADGVSAADGTGNPDEALVVVWGSIRFDGCSHWVFNDSQALHLCGLNGLRQFQTSQDRLFEEAKKRMLSWSGD